MSHWFALLACLLLLAVPGAGPAYGAADGEHKPSPFAGALDLTIWTWVVFLLLFFVLKKYAWGPMLEGLNRREENIHLAMAEAQKVREEAETLRGQLKAEMDKVHDTIRGLMEEAHRDAESTKAQKLVEAEDEIKVERERALREIHTARDQALQDLWNQSVQLATLVSSKAIRRELTAEDHRRLMDEALAEMRQAAAAQGNGRR